MGSTNGILALIGDQALRDDVDRVSAAAGLRVVHASEPSSRKVWTGAVAVLLDVHGGPPLRPAGHATAWSRRAGE